MKTLLLVRHAKSDWSFEVEDFNRPLNSRGRTDALEMAKRLIKNNIKIDAFVSSPAKRAITTAGFFAEAYAEKTKNILTLSSLYQPTITAFYNAIENLDDSLKTIALFSHNPGITEFANQLTAVRVDDLPTCAVFAVKADVKKWKEFSTIKKEFWFLDYPKKD